MNLLPEWALFYGGLTISVVSAFLVLSNLMQAVLSYRHSRYRWLEKLFWATLWLYGVGAGLKFAGVGPEWVRWYMGDIGFPLFAAMVFSRQAAQQFHWDRSMSSLECAERAVGFGGVWRRGVLFGLVASFAYEIVAGLVVSKVRQKKPGEELGVGSFDVIDIAHYSIGALIGWTLWHVWLRRAQIWLRVEQVDAEVAAAEDKAARKMAKKERPRRLKPGQRRRRGPFKL